MPRLHALLCVLCATAAVISTATAQSSAIGFQAKLTGVPDGPHTMIFSLYDVEMGGTPLQTVGPQAVTVTGGVVSTGIAFDPAHWTGQPRWVSIITDGVSADPRVEVQATPLAQVARKMELPNARVTGSSAAYALNLELLQTPSSAHIYRADGHQAVTFSSSQASDGDWYDALILRGSNKTYKVLAIDNGSTYGWQFYQPKGESVDRNKLFVQQFGNTNGALIFGGSGQAYKVGIGVSDPADTLHVFGVIRTNMLRIVEGCDLAEPFNVAPADAGDGEAVEPVPGMVVAIDEANTGMLRIADTAYDTKVAGVISGANGLAPGMVMGKEGDSLTSGEHPIAMTGRVWVLADATLGPIAPGDRLTSSPTPGHAMKAADPARADGTVIGKAMTGLGEGRGMVLVLVNLQ